MKLPIKIDRQYIIDSNDKLIAAITTVSDEKEFYDYVVRAVNSYADTLSRAYRRGFYDGLEQGRKV